MVGNQSFGAGVADSPWFVAGVADSQSTAAGILELGPIPQSAGAATAPSRLQFSGEQTKLVELDPGSSSQTCPGQNWRRACWPRWRPGLQAR